MKGTAAWPHLCFLLIHNCQPEFLTVSGLPNEPTNLPAGGHELGLASRSGLTINRLSMKNSILFSLIAATALALSSLAQADAVKTYQVTGPILEMNDSMIAVQKGKDRWEVARDASSQLPSDLKVGDKVNFVWSPTNVICSW